MHVPEKYFYLHIYHDMFFVGSTKNMLGTANKNKTVQTIYHDVRYISKCFVSFLNYPAFPYAHPLHTHTRYTTFCGNTSFECDNLHAFSVHSTKNAGSSRKLSVFKAKKMVAFSYLYKMFPIFWNKNTLIIYILIYI